MASERVSSTWGRVCCTRFHIMVTVAQQQLGLTLTKGKVALDVLVIDHAEKVPTEN
jgi:uncharacterized protein (TIGR03435 family)